MKLEADRTRLDAAHAGEEEPGQQLLITDAALHLLRYCSQQSLARRLLNQAHQRLDIGIEQDFVARNLGLVRGDRRQTVEKGEVGKPDQRTCLQAVRDKLAAIDGAKPRNPPEGATP